MLSHDYDFIVKWGECDPAGIVYYPNYFVWFDAGSHRMFAAAGISQRQFVEMHGLLGAALVTAHGDYKLPVSYGDTVRHRVAVSELGERTIAVQHTLLRDDVVVADGYEKRICLVRDEAGKVRSTPIPPALRRVLEGADAAA